MPLKSFGILPMKTLNLPTSITIGIKETIEESLEEADEYLGRGFRALKVKIGHSFEQESELLTRLREEECTRESARTCTDDDDLARHACRASPSLTQMASGRALTLLSAVPLLQPC